MPTKPIPKGMTPFTPEMFREEAQRRLVDSWDMMLAFGLRSRAAVLARVEKGSLPRPVIQRASIITLWDADEVEAATGITVTPASPDREED